MSKCPKCTHEGVREHIVYECSRCGEEIHDYEELAELRRCKKALERVQTLVRDPLYMASERIPKDALLDAIENQQFLFAAKVEG